MEQPPTKKGRLLEMGDDIEPMKVDVPGSSGESMDPPLEDDLMQVDSPSLGHSGHHSVVARLRPRVHRRGARISLLPSKWPLRCWQ